MATPFLCSSFLPSSLPTTTVRTITNSLHRLIIVASSPTFKKSKKTKESWSESPRRVLNKNKNKNKNKKENSSSIKSTSIKKRKANNNNDRIIVKSRANTVSEALSEAIENKQWHYALQVFEMLKKQPFYQPKQKTYMKLLALLGRSGQPGQACRLFDEMLEEGIEPTSELYTALLSACCRSNLIDKALTVLDQMKSHSQCQPDLHTFSILIKACIDAGRFELVEPLYDQMAQLLITPTTAMQNIVIAGYGKAGKHEEMEKILTKMLDGSASDPDVWTMNSVLTLFGNEGQIEMMEMWYEKFRDIGIEPESRTFNILISVYGRKGMYDKMSSVMEYMRRLSFPWTTSTYNSVIEAFSNAGDAENMEYTFDQMQAEGIKADTKTMCCLIRGYADAGLFRKVVSTVQLAGILETPENTTFFNAVIYACSRKEDLVEMENVFQRMKSKSCKPDSTTYNTMIDAYRKVGSIDKVRDMEQELKLISGKACKVDGNVES